MNQTTRFVFVDPNFDPRSLVFYSPFIIFETSILGFSAICAFIVILVCASSNLKDPTYKFILVVAITDCIYMTLLILQLFLDASCTPTPFISSSSAQYITLFLRQLINNCITSSLVLFSILSEIFLSAQRLFLIRGMPFLKNLTVKHVGPILGVISLIYYLPSWFTDNVKPNGIIYSYKGENYTAYTLGMTEFGETSASTWLGTVLDFFRMFLVNIVLLIVNIISIISFRKYMANKSNLIVQAHGSKLIFLEIAFKN
jgi:hypothetical protein